MSEPSDLPPTGQAAGCVVFVVDESTALETRIAGGTKSKAECIATAVNSLLAQLTAADLDVAIVGYRGDGQGGAEVGCRWGGSLAGRRLVPAGQLADSPLTVENRVRRVPAPGNPGMLQEETVRFPVWYVPTLASIAYPVMGYGYCQHLLSAWVSSASPLRKPPMVVSFVGDWLPQKAQQAVERIMGVASPLGPPLLLHVHLGGTSAARPVLYPSADSHLPADCARELFSCSSVLPDFMLAALRGYQVPVNSGARGMIFNATMADMIRLLSLVKAYAQFDAGPVAVSQPAAACPGSEATGGETGATVGLSNRVSCTVGQASSGTQAIALVVLLVDRSVSNPADPSGHKTWTKIQDHANDLLGQIVKRGKERVEAALVSYGAGPDGVVDLRTEFAGPLSGRTFANGVDLAAGSLRIAEVTEQIPNGIGGLISFTRKKPIFLDIEPAAAVPAAPAIETAGRLVAEWCSRHPGSPCPPVVLHLTRAQFDLEPAAAAMDGLYRTGAILYHLVVTETPHRSLAYPATPEKIADPHLQKVWEWTSPLLGSDRLAAEKPAVVADSRGMVINGRFDLLLDGILSRMEPSAADQPQG